MRGTVVVATQAEADRRTGIKGVLCVLGQPVFKGETLNKPKLKPPHYLTIPGTNPCPDDPLMVWDLAEADLENPEGWTRSLDLKKETDRQEAIRAVAVTDGRTARMLDDLLDALFEKGVLTREEYQEDALGHHDEREKLRGKIPKKR